MEPKLDHLTNVAQSLTSGFEFLKDLGFSDPTMHVETSRLLGQSLLLIFAAKNEQRSVEVSFVPASSARPITLSVFLCKPTGERFSLEDWVQQRLPDARLSFSAQGGDDETLFISQICKGCSDVLCGPLRSTLLGSAWDVVAIDWKGYR
jgi:hypothetical protein